MACTVYAVLTMQCIVKIAFQCRQNFLKTKGIKEFSIKVHSLFGQPATSMAYGTDEKTRAPLVITAAKRLHKNSVCIVQRSSLQCTVNRPNRWMWLQFVVLACKQAHSQPKKSSSSSKRDTCILNESEREKVKMSKQSVRQKSQSMRGCIEHINASECTSISFLLYGSALVYRLVDKKQIDALNRLNVNTQAIIARDKRAFEQNSYVTVLQFTFSVGTCYMHNRFVCIRILAQALTRHGLLDSTFFIAKPHALSLCHRNNHKAK